MVKELRLFRKENCAICDAPVQVVNIDGKRFLKCLCGSAPLSMPINQEKIYFEVREIGE